MPQETAKITFYKVNECGFYARGETTPKFGSIQDLLLSLEDWSQGKQLVETKTYEPNGSSEQMPCYLLNILSSGSSWLVTIWNETPSTDGQTASAVGTSNVGNAQIVMNELPEGGIPGFATYFWFIPELNIFASIRFQHLISGQKPMQLYMESYLALFSPFVVVTEPDENEDIFIIGYKANPEDEAADLYPKFRTCLFKKRGNRDLLLAKAHDIRKIIRKASLRLSRPEDLSHWQRLLTALDLRTATPNDEAIKVKYEVGANLSRDDLHALIEGWEQEHERQWDDYGFQFRGDNAIHWLSHSIARSEYQVEIRRENAEVVNASMLLSELERLRPEIIRLVN